MEWVRLFHRILTIILTPFALVGCVAVLTSPITATLWLIWLLVAIARPSARASWYCYTRVISVTLLCVAAIGLVSAIDPNQFEPHASSAAVFFFVCLFGSAMTALIWLPSFTTPSWMYRWYGMLFGALFILGSLAIALR